MLEETAEPRPSAGFC